jgi:hypothetical protein
MKLYRGVFTTAFLLSSTIVLATSDGQGPSRSVAGGRANHDSASANPNLQSQ